MAADGKPFLGLEKSVEKIFPSHADSKVSFSVKNQQKNKGRLVSQVPKMLKMIILEVTIMVIYSRLSNDRDLNFP